MLRSAPRSGAVVSADRLLVATGRRPNVEAWRATGLAQTERGWLKVDPATLEAHPGVFGAGDVTGLGADVIHPFPAFNRVLGATVEELAANTAMRHVA